MPLATQAFGIDTSVFLRLLTGHPAEDFQATVRALNKIQGRHPASELVVSNQVIGETSLVP